MLAVGVLRVAVQPALEVKAGNQLCCVVVAEFFLTLREQLAAGMVNTLNLTF